ncbi:helix-turn-helix domain-containing protein [Chloroflexota bacterium]
MKNLNQSQLAKKLGISKSYLSMIKNGQRQGSPEIMREISSLKVHKSEAKGTLARRRSTAELLPLKKDNY